MTVHGPRQGGARSMPLESLKLRLGGGFGVSLPEGKSLLELSIEPAYKLLDFRYGMGHLEGIGRFSVDLEPVRFKRAVAELGVRWELPLYWPDWLSAENRFVAGALAGAGVNGEGGVEGSVGVFAGLALCDKLSFLLNYNFIRDRGMGDEHILGASFSFDLLSPIRQKRRREVVFGDARSLRQTKAEREFFGEIFRETKRRRQDFLKIVRFLRERGARFKPGRTAAVLGESFDLGNDVEFWRLFGRVFEDLKVKQVNIPHERGKREYLDFVWDIGSRRAIETDQRFLKPEELEFNANTMMVSVGSFENSFRIVMWDWFDDRPFFDRSYPKTERLSESQMGFYREAIGGDIRTALDEYFANADVQRRIGDLKPLSADEKRELEERTVFRSTLPPAWTAADIEAGRRSLHDLSEFSEIHVEAQPFQSDFDRQGNELSTFSFGEAANGREKRPVFIHGFLNAIVVSIKEGERRLALGRSNEELLKKLARGDLPDLQFFFDRYRNVIVPIGRTDERSGQRVIGDFLIIPSQEFARTEDDLKKSHGISVDLTQFGLGEYRMIAASSAIPPMKVQVAGSPYRFYSTLFRADQPKADGLVERISGAMNGVERAFGIPSGASLKNCVFVPSAHKNAHFSLANPGSIFIWDEFLTDLGLGKLDFIIAHESFHAIDFEFGITKSESLARLFPSPEFCAFIDEKNFLSAGIGGHSGENEKELFATLMNTIYSASWEDWLKKMEDAPYAILHEYEKALVALKSALVEKVPKIENAPIFAELERRLAKTRELYSRTPTELLKKAGMQIIHNGDFEREVLQANEPVILYLYTDDKWERPMDRTDETIAFAARHKGKAKVLAMPFAEIPDSMRRQFETYYFDQGNLSSNTFHLFREGRLICGDCMLYTIEDQLDLKKK